MIKLIFNSLLALSLIYMNPTVAKKKSTRLKKKTQTTYGQLKSNFKTDHKFDDDGIKGTYKNAHGSMILVEKEKNLNDLLEERTNFKDRMKNQIRGY